jgi:hypothetical protein
MVGFWVDRAGKRRPLTLRQSPSLTAGPRKRRTMGVVDQVQIRQATFTSCRGATSARFNRSALGSSRVAWLGDWGGQQQDPKGLTPAGQD